MANGQTANYALNQWAASDQVLRAEFNADNAKIDGALAKKFGLDNMYLATGTYVGAGSVAVSVTTGFRPSLVIIFCISPGTGSYDYIFMIGDQSAQMLETQFSSREVRTDALTFSDTGFSIPAGVLLHIEDWSYHYIAFR